jgi:hypothetical protein
MIQRWLSPGAESGGGLPPTDQSIPQPAVSKSDNGSGDIGPNYPTSTRHLTYGGTRTTDRSGSLLFSLTERTVVIRPLPVLDFDPVVDLDDARPFRRRYA